MKKLLLLTFAFCLSTFAFAQQYGWVDISANMPKLGGFNDIHVIGNEIWITGGNAEVFYSPDGGETFQIQTLPANSGISSSIFMKNNKLGYVVTYSGNILKTANGGTNWTMLHEPGGALNSVHFPPNSDTGYTCGTNGTVWQFDDESITDISPSDNASNLQSICCPVDNTDVKVCGQTTIARHKNNTWANLQFWDSTIFYNSIFFINNTTGWCVGIDGTIIIVVDGISWVGQTSNTTKTLNDVFFINSLEGWAAGTEVLLHTLDGGETWTQEIASQTSQKLLRAIYFTSANNGYVVGNGTVLKYGIISGEANNDATLSSIQINNEELAGFNVATLNYQVELPTGTTIVPTLAATPTDTEATIVITQAAEIPGTATILVTAEDGETQQTYSVEFTVAQNTGWQVLNPESIPGTPDLSDVFFVSDNEGWITSSSIAEIYHTTDGGETFEVQTNQFSTALEAILMIDDNEGYAGGGSGFVYRTTDGGENWNFHGSIPSTLSDIDFGSDTQGYACGDGGAVFSITSQGVTNLNSGLNSNLSGISSPSVDKVWICGSGTISHYNGTTFEFQSGPVGSYNAIFFIDDNEGWVVGNSGLIGHTENKGEDWHRQTNPDPDLHSLYDLFFLDENNGWAVGSLGTIIHTIDGGETWELQGQGLTTNFLRGVYFTSPTNGYAVGNGKTLLKYTAVTVDENTDATLGSIQINSEELAGFNTQTLVYNLELPAGTTEIPNITVTATINEATVEITQAPALPGTATIVVTAKDGVTQKTYTIHFTVVTGIEDFKETFEFEIYPNPTASVVSLQSAVFSLQPSVVELYDLTGKKLLEKQIQAGSENAEIDVSHLKSGVYFCRLFSEKYSATEKIIIQK